MAAYAPRRSTGPILGSTSNSGRLNRHYSTTDLYNRSISMTSRVDKKPAAGPKRACMCSPTNHPGSFRCSLHKSLTTKPQTPPCGSSGRLNMRRSAMKNSLVRIGAVKGEWVRRALAALIRPSSHQQRRRTEFRRRPTRLSVVS
ncbi:hypothetical protein SASPL_128516 [Salvia splendens]|uniref:Serine-rich protein-like protein n=1 Tax=Salvia splendens TaxID=180675 RepID=A0A8X8XBF5_SALSN|nr:uncharacterized protein LOC121752588 [Salvia splendens]KAG6410455.1 hypothetical protein SASPL_128516 [Salvia splendens]